MKILLVNTGIIPVPPPKGGAIENHTYNLAREFVKLGHTVGYITDVTSKFDIKKIQVYPVGTAEISFQQDYFKMGIRNVKAAIRTAEIAQQLAQDYDVTHIHEKLSARLFSIKNKTKWVYTLHNPLPSVFKYKNPLIQLIRELSTKALDIPVVNRANKTIVVSSSLKKELVKEYSVPKDKIEFIPNGVDTNFFNPKKKTSKTKLNLPDEYILFVGRLDYRKGVHILLQSMKGLNIPLVIVGGGPEENKLKYLAKKLNIEKNVIFLNAVEREELPKIYARATIFVLPSLGEGLPLVVLEAMASGLPIIATDISGIRDAICDKNGIIIPPNDISALKKAIKTIMNKNIQELGNESRRIVDLKFSWSQIARKIIELYMEL